MFNDRDAEHSFTDFVTRTINYSGFNYVRTNRWIKYRLNCRRPSKPHSLSRKRADLRQGTMVNRNSIFTFRKLKQTYVYYTNSISCVFKLGTIITWIDLMSFSSTHAYSFLCVNLTLQILVSLPCRKESPGVFGDSMSLNCPINYCFLCAVFVLSYRIKYLKKKEDENVLKKKNIWI